MALLGSILWPISGGAGQADAETVPQGPSRPMAFVQCASSTQPVGSFENCGDIPIPLFGHLRRDEVMEESAG